MKAPASGSAAIGARADVGARSGGVAAEGLACALAFAVSAMVAMVGGLSVVPPLGSVFDLDLRHWETERRQYRRGRIPEVDRHYDCILLPSLAPSAAARPADDIDMHAGCPMIGLLAPGCRRLLLASTGSQSSTSVVEHDLFM